MKLNFKLYVFVLAFLFLLAVPSFVFAQNQERASSRSSISAERSAGRQTRIAERCDRITDRIDKLIERYDVNRDKYADRHDDIETRVGGLLTRLEAAGYDVSEVRRILTNLAAANAGFKSKYSGFVSRLENAKQFACGDSEGEFVNAVQDARSELKAAREEAQALRRVAKDDLKAALQDLREQVKSARATSSSSAEDN